MSAPLLDIPVGELLRAGVWEFLPEDEERDETHVVPVAALPVSGLNGRVAVVNASLANGTELPVALGSVLLSEPRLTQQFLSASFYLPNSGWFHLARYFDPDWERRGPTALAAALGRSVREIFPIRYDLTAIAIGDRRVVVGEIPAEPAERIDHEERMRLILDSAKAP